MQFPSIDIFSGAKMAARFIVLATLGFPLLAPVAVRAHAVPERAIPPIDGTVNTPPPVLEIWFTEDVIPDSLTIQVIGPSGQSADQQDAAVDLNDPQRRHVTVSLAPSLPSGVYVVQWHATSSIDGDPADGSFRFTIDPKAPTSTVAVPVASLTDPNQATDQNDGDAFGLVDLWPLLLVGLLGVTALWFVRRYRSVIRGDSRSTQQIIDPNTGDPRDEY